MNFIKSPNLEVTIYRTWIFVRQPAQQNYIKPTPTLILTPILNNLYRIYSATYGVVLYYFAELAAEPITILLYIAS